MSNKGKLLGFGALGLALLASSKKATANTAVKDTANASLSFSNTGTDVDSVLNIIKNNGAIRTLLKGEKGDSIKGDAGANGRDGANNYLNSLVNNGAIEKGTLEGWQNGVLSSDFYQGMRYITSIDHLSFTTSDFFYLDPRKLYKCTANVKATGTNIIFVCYTPTGSSLVYPVFSVKNVDDTFGEWVFYFGGIGAVSSNVPAESFKSQLFFSGNNVTLKNTSINRLIVKEVESGEIVPHNLPFLPLNQTVINSVTGKVGIYNGSTVDYYF